jgi:hypothetical protein
MMQKSLIGGVLLQMLGVSAYFGLVVILYWRGLTDAGAVAIILGLLFLFKSVVDSGTISIAHSSPSDPELKIGAPGVELFKALTFFGVGMGYGSISPRQWRRAWCRRSCRPLSFTSWWFVSSPFA